MPKNFPSQTDNGRHYNRSKVIAKLLDEAFTIPVINKKIGFDAIAGIIPGFGDIIPLICSLYIVWQAHLDGVNKWTLSRMLKNILFDSIGGSIPILGDVFDMLFKANTKNIALWEKNLNLSDRSFRNSESSHENKDKVLVLASITVIFIVGIVISVSVVMLFIHLFKEINF